MILNDRTSVVHKEDSDESDLQAECGALRRVDDGRLEPVDAPAGEREEFQWCGRCFERGGGY